MKFLFDLFPLLCFFAVWWVSDIFLATIAIIVATFAQVGWLRVRKRPIEPVLWVTLVIVVVFGGLTIYFHDDRFIRWKPTVIYWLFSVALVISTVFFKKNLIQAMLSKAELRLPDAIWTRLNWAWSGFFAFMGVANLYVAFTFSQAVWVYIKTFGFTTMLVLFVLGQVLFLARYVEEGKQ